MHLRRTLLTLPVTMILIALAACSAQDTVTTPQVEPSPAPFVPTEVPADSSPLDTSGPTLDWVTLPAGICQDIVVTVAAELSVPDIGMVTDAPFEDYLGGTAGTGCLITVGGTGADFAGHFEVFMQLKNMLAIIGWTPDPQYDGGGPTSTLGGFRREAGLMLVTVGWEPSADANCPDDQAISACTLTPEQQIYNITLSIAMQ